MKERGREGENMCEEESVRACACALQALNIFTYTLVCPRTRTHIHKGTRAHKHNYS